jgi:hypothetical protein
MSSKWFMVQSRAGIILEKTPHDQSISFQLGESHSGLTKLNRQLRRRRICLTTTRAI